MAIDFNQGEVISGTTRAACSGRSVGSRTGVGGIVPCSDGGTFGSAASGVFMAGSETDVVTYNMICTVASGVSWNGGTWTWRLNVTTSNMNMTLTEVYICRVNSSDVNQATIGSATGLGISLGSTGVVSGNITGSAQTPSAGDYVNIVFVMTNGSMNNQNILQTPDQVINSPFTAPVVIIPARNHGYIID